MLHLQIEYTMKPSNEGDIQTNLVNGLLFSSGFGTDMRSEFANKT